MTSMLLKRASQVLYHAYDAAGVRLCRMIFERGQLDTSPVIHLDEVGFDAPDRKEYEPSSWFYISRALRGCRIQRSDVFVDFGSGMGRVVVQVACRYPFGRVIGVEIVEAFNRIAEHNLNRSRHKLRCTDVEFMTCDVLDYEIPDDMTYAYFYNPFVDDLFRQMLDNIIRSVDRNPRLVTLIYANPKMEPAILASGRFELVRTSRGLPRPDFEHQRIAIYESRPPHADSGDPRADRWIRPV